MRRVAVHIIGILFVTIGFSQEAIKPIPNLGQLDLIDIDQDAGLWSASFYSNGGAHLIIGSNDSAHVPEGSFSFEEIYNLLVPHLKPVTWIRGTVNVHFFISDEPQTDAVFRLEDKDIMRKITHGLCDKILSSPDVVFSMDRQGERFKGELRKYPLVPGDPPYLKAGEEAGEGEGISSKEEGVGSKEGVADNKEEVGRSKEEVGGDEAEEEMPVAVKKAGRPSLLFYVGIGVLACVGAVLFLTRKR